MLDRASTWQVNQWLMEVVNGDSWCGLGFEIPNEADPSSVEVYGPGYARRLVSWERTGRALLNRTALEFEGLDTPIQIASTMVFAGQTGNVLRAYGRISQPVTLVEGNSYVVGVGELIMYIA